MDGTPCDVNRGNAAGHAGCLTEARDAPYRCSPVERIQVGVPFAITAGLIARLLHGVTFRESGLEIWLNL